MGLLDDYMRITTMEYNVIFNGDRIGPIVPELGLQQGRPFRIGKLHGG